MLAFLRRFGARRLAACVLCRAWYGVLRAIFRFDAWHAVGGYACRPYKALCVEAANSLHPRVVIDVGCGLGEIVSRIDAAEQRLGFDPSDQVIRAARLLNGRRAWFGVAAPFAVAPIAAALDGPADLVILTGWTHGVSPDALTSYLEALRDATGTRRIMIDTVRDAPPGVAWSHDLAGMGSLGRVERSFDGGDGTRDLHIIRCDPRPAAGRAA